METAKIEDFLNTLSDSIDRDKVELYKKIIGSSEIKSFDGPDEFFYAVLYPFEKFISGFLYTELEGVNRDVIFIYKNSQYIDRSFAQLFIKYEGSACSSDKSRTIVKRLVDFYQTGKKIEFDYNAEYTFHMPKTIFKTHEHIVLFYEGLKDLQYGDNRKYFEAMKTIFIDGK